VATDESQGTEQQANMRIGHPGWNAHLPDNIPAAPARSYGVRASQAELGTSTLNVYAFVEKHLDGPSCVVRAAVRFCQTPLMRVWMVFDLIRGYAGQVLASQDSHIVHPVLPNPLFVTPQLNSFWSQTPVL
jgi:hypothetical protein